MADTNNNGIPDNLEANDGSGITTSAAADNSSVLAMLMGAVSQNGGTAPLASAGGHSSVPGVTAASNVPMIYMGTTPAAYLPYTPHQLVPESQLPGDMGSELALEQKVPSQSHSKSADEFMQGLDKLSVSQQHTLYAQLLLAGYGGSIKLPDIKTAVRLSSFQDLYSTYRSFAQDLADHYNQFNGKMTPDDWLKYQIGYRLSAEGIKWNGKLSSLNLNAIFNLANQSKDSLAGTRTATSVSRDFLNPEDAKSLVRGTLQQELGRDPTQSEFQDFLAAIHQAEAANPNKTTTTTTTDATGRIVSQNSTTQQGINSAGLGEMALEKAQQQPGWAEWQAMGTYFPALMQALGSAVPGT